MFGIILDSGIALERNTLHEGCCKEILRGIMHLLLGHIWVGLTATAAGCELLGAGDLLTTPHSWERESALSGLSVSGLSCLQSHTDKSEDGKHTKGVD